MNVRGTGSKHIKARKAKVTHIPFTLFLIMIVSPLAACAPPIGTFSATSTTTPKSSASATTILPVTSLTETPTLPATPAGMQNSSSSLTFSADADARTKETDPDKNYGNGETLQVDGAKDPDAESFIRFTVTGVTGAIQSAQLRLYVTNDGTRDGPAVYTADNLWTESAITWNTRPTHTSDAADDKGRLPAETWAEYDVTPLVTGNGTFSFLLATDNSDGVFFSSREGSQPPQLVITLVSTPASIQTPVPRSADGGVVFVGAGDISTCGNNNDELTAQLLDTIPGIVFTTGDNAYSDGTRTQFNNCFNKTWGRFKNRMKPVPGNHEYHTSGAAGYFDYFDNIPSYYAYDLGSWRVYALNSEIDVSGSSPQVTWLRSDLAANPRQCVLAYWHQPRWSSGNTHGSNPDYQTLWQIFYDAGAELVLNGHEHNYERFAPMNAAGEADPVGLREFVLGMGGKNHYDFGKILPASEAHDNTSYGVLKLVLRPNGYDWQFVPAPGSTFTDSGSANCH